MTPEPRPKDALDDLVQRMIAEDPSYAGKWESFLVGLDLRARRRGLEVSEEEVAARMEVNVLAVRRLERDPMRVSVRRMRAYLAALGAEMLIVPLAAEDPA